MLARPLAGWSIVAAFALIGAALLATAWTTRSTIVDATDEVRRGEALAAEQAVRADLADLGGPPDAGDLHDMLAEHAGEGVRYLAILDKRMQPLATAGTSVTQPGDDERAGKNRRLALSHGRIRLELRAGFRRAWGSGAHAATWVVIEVEPVAAEGMATAATRTVWIGVIAALTLLGVALVLVRREIRRRDEQRAREREKRLASLGEMSAVLAHEIKNPLASLKGNAQLLVAMLPDGEKPRAKAERVVDEALRLEKLTQDLLAFVRTGEIRKEAIDPVALVTEAAGDRATIEAAGAPAKWTLDAARMRQVIVNLVDNALAAGPPVRVTVRVTSGALAIEVADKGPGVPPAERDKIFEPFFTGKTQGTGLGLAVAHRVVEAHGGTIDVADAPGGGALFRVIIP